MEALLVREHDLQHHVLTLLKDQSQPVESILQAFDKYREICLANSFADIAHVQEHQSRLWLAHTDGKRYFHDARNEMRKLGNGKSVQARHLAKMFKGWIKSSVQYYHAFILQLNSTFGGIPELQAVAHQVKSEISSESLQTQLSPTERAAVLAICHQALIYIGDLWRYRASEKLDNTSDFGPAIGYYGLANALRPSSGMGHHQQAAVALEQRAHLRSIHHLYRAIVVEEPHPRAAKNLQLEFGKVNAAWEKGELIPKTTPNDPDAAKLVLVGWFVRMHGMCAKGEVFSSHAELEREVLSQLDSVLRKGVSISQTTIMRLVMINMAAQYHAEQQQLDAQQSFFYFFRLNIKTLTVLLRIFHDTIRGLAAEIAGAEDLAPKLSSVVRQLLPALRLYSSWLMCNLHLVAGLDSDDFLGDSIKALWTAYARAVDVLADEDVFGVWALDDFGITYMLEEDVDTLGFKPLLDGQQVHRNWTTTGGMSKPRFSDAGLVRASDDVEMLARVKDLLEDGSYLAHEAQDAPIGIVGDRIYYGQALLDALAAAEEAKNRPPPPPKIKAKAPPLSYAAAAKSNSAVKKPSTRASNGLPSASTTTSRSRQDQLARMIDNLLDDDDGNNPVTPPQQHVAHPAVVTNGDTHYNVTHYAGQHAEFTSVPSYQPKLPSAGPIAPPSQPIPIAAPSSVRTPRQSLTASSVERLQSVSKLWNEPGHPSSGFPSGLPMGTLASPPTLHQRASHSRVNSANSIRSRTSHGMNVGDSWSSLESTPAVRGPQTPQKQANGAIDGYANFSASHVASPLLFGAGGGIWSTGQTGNGAYRNVSPPGENGGQVG
ncbi:hypothetical protein LTR53_007863 [Teratosphaeriaceae sp. CCFEE 6253]|nr:hypothetical protein LTR53_007863 [Teratosphaeriaceae sp. CCFEE 6253]